MVTSAPFQQYSADAYMSNVMSDTTVMRMRAMADLEINMDHLEKIIVQKDSVIEGLRLTLDKALQFLETGAADKLRKE